MSLSHRSRLPLAGAVLIAGAVAVAGVAGLAIGQAGVSLAALHAAGLVGTAPANSGVISGLIRTLQGNVIWLIATGFGLVIAIIAFMLFFGSQRGMEQLAKVAIAIMLILVVAPAALA